MKKVSLPHFFTIFTNQIKNTMFQKLVAIEPVSLVLSAEKSVIFFCR